VDKAKFWARIWVKAGSDRDNQVIAIFALMVASLGLNQP
jgi:hypothetical protein